MASVPGRDAKYYDGNGLQHQIDHANSCPARLCTFAFATYCIHEMHPKGHVIETRSPSLFTPSDFA